MRTNNRPKIAAVVPAYNERDRLPKVLEAIKNSSLIDEIIVVSDGSTDGTFEIAESDTAVKAINLERNLGKGGAMCVGANSTDAEIILFLDADLIGLDGNKVDAIVSPVVEEKADMAIGIFKGGRSSTDIAQFLTPYISGQRAMRREVFLNIPRLDSVRSGVETAITKYFRSRKLKVQRVHLTGCTHTMKEEKLGFFKGFICRLRMYYDISKILLDGKDFKRK